MITPEYSIYPQQMYPSFYESNGDKGPNPEPFQYMQAASGPSGERVCIQDISGDITKFTNKSISKVMN